MLSEQFADTLARTAAPYSCVQQELKERFDRMMSPDWATEKQNIELNGSDPEYVIDEKFVCVTDKSLLEEYVAELDVSGQLQNRE